MNSRQSSGGLPALSVILGTFAAPLAQWVVFFLVARVGGSADAGAFALLFAVATPLVTATNWGLRNGYITLIRRWPFADFVTLRIVGCLVASVLLVAFGALARLDSTMVAGVVAMKFADSMTDIWYGRWQRQQRLLRLGTLMVINGVASVGFATLFALTGFPSSWIVVGSALGSITALVGALTIDLRDILDWARGRGFGWVGAGARLQRILSDCWQICAGQVLAGAVVSVPTWAVGIFGSTDDIGRFAAAAYMITAGSLLGASLNSVLISRYHVSMTSGGVAAVQASVGRNNATVTVLGLLLVIGVGFLGESLFQLIYGAQFAFTAAELSIIALAAALNPGTYLMNAALLAVNSYAAQMFVYAAALIGSITATWVAASMSTSGFMIGAICALSGSVIKYGLSAAGLHRVARVASRSYEKDN